MKVKPANQQADRRPRGNRRKKMKQKKHSTHMATSEGDGSFLRTPAVMYRAA